MISITNIWKSNNVVRMLILKKVKATNTVYRYLMNIHFRRAEIIQAIKIAAREGIRFVEPPSVMSRL